MYNEFIDIACQVINDNFSNLTEEEVKVLVWRLGSFVEGKKKSFEFKERVLDMNRYYLDKRFSQKKRVRSLLAFTSLCLNDNLDYKQFSIPEAAFLASYVDTLNKDQEKATVMRYGTNGTIPLLCQKVKDDKEKAFYLNYYESDPESLRRDLMEKPISIIRTATQYYLSEQNSQGQVGGFYHNGSRRF